MKFNLQPTRAPSTAGQEGSFPPVALCLSCSCVPRSPFSDDRTTAACHRLFPVIFSLSCSLVLTQILRNKGLTQSRQTHSPEPRMPHATHRSSSSRARRQAVTLSVAVDVVAAPRERCGGKSSLSLRPSSSSLLRSSSLFPPFTLCRRACVTAAACVFGSQKISPLLLLLLLLSPSLLLPRPASSLPSPPSHSDWISSQFSFLVKVTQIKASRRQFLF